MILNALQCWRRAKARPRVERSSALRPYTGLRVAALALYRDPVHDEFGGRSKARRIALAVGKRWVAADHRAGERILVGPGAGVDLVAIDLRRLDGGPLNARPAADLLWRPDRPPAFSGSIRGDLAAGGQSLVWHARAADAPEDESPGQFSLAGAFTSYMERSTWSGLHGAVYMERSTAGPACPP